MNIKKYLFWIVVLVQVIAIIFSLDSLDQVCRSVLMIALLIYFWDQTDHIKETKWVRYTTLAIAFSWIGDIMFVLFEKNFLFFFFGLSAMFAAHVFYILAFRRATFAKNLAFKLSFIPFLAIAYYIFIDFLILPYLDGIVQVPIVLYGLSLLVMFIFAWYRNSQTNSLSFQFVLLGVLFFIVSNSVLVVNRFSFTINYAEYISLAFYILGQWLTVTGLIKHGQGESIEEN